MSTGTARFDLAGPGPRPPALPLGLEAKFLPVTQDKVLPGAHAQPATERKPYEINIAIAAGVALMLYGLIYFAVRPVVFSGGSPDFSTLYRAGRIVNAGKGAQVYDSAAQARFDAQSHMLPALPRIAHFELAPSILAIFAPLSRLSYGHAELLWYAVNVGMLAFVPFVLRRRVGLSGKLMISDLLAPVAFVPALAALVEGEASILVFLLFTLAFVELRSNRDLRAGGLLALAAFKPQLVLPLLLALMLGRRWKAVCGFAATALPIIATSFLLVRWHGLAGFAHAIRLTSSSPESLGSSSVSYMPTIQGMADQLLQNGMSVSAINVAALALSCGLLLIAAVYLRNHLDEPLGFSVMVAVTLLTSYNCSLSDYSLLLLPIFLTISYASGRHMTPAKKLLRYTLACLFIAPVLSFFVGAMAVALFLATIALAVQQVLELRRGPAGVLLSRPAYVRPRLAAS